MWNLVDWLSVITAPLLLWHWHTTTAPHPTPPCSPSLAAISTHTHSWGSGPMERWMSSLGLPVGSPSQCDTPFMFFRADVTQLDSSFATPATPS